MPNLNPKPRKRTSKLQRKKVPTKTLDILSNFPVNLSVAKSHLRFTSNSENNNIDRYIMAAVNYAESRMWRSVVKKRLLTTLDSFPKQDFEQNRFERYPRSKVAIELDFPPLIEVESIQYYNGEGELVALDESEYYVDNVSEPGRIEPVGTWPNTQDRINAVQITYVAGYDEDYPQQILQGVQMLVGHFFNQRESVVVAHGAVTVKEVPESANALFDMYSVRVP